MSLLLILPDRQIGGCEKESDHVVVLTNARCDMMLACIEAGYFRMHLSITSWL